MREVLDVMIQEAENDEKLLKDSADDGNDSVMILLSDEQHKKLLSMPVCHANPLWISTTRYCKVSYKRPFV
jgi:hypothetical protein